MRGIAFSGGRALTSRSLCCSGVRAASRSNTLVDEIPKGKRYALFPGKPFHTFPGISPRPTRTVRAAPSP
ncbi:MAG: hypothetical protein EOS27_05115 [Mesorhizobium sp.]|nr:MAG: hypothetical protein EOS27_05115 [Mesorhizobium sp.]TIX26745.1 MAG: hypothetical protein E5V35_09310 [Mesorhizobium sp.]